MWSKVKNVWGWIVAVLGLIIGALWYYISFKQKETNALLVKVQLLETEKQADILETEINGLKDDRKLTQIEVLELDRVLASIENKRADLRKELSSKSPKDVENYWENE